MPPGSVPFQISISLLSFYFFKQLSTEKDDVEKGIGIFRNEVEIKIKPIFFPVKEKRKISITDRDPIFQQREWAVNQDSGLIHDKGQGRC